MKVDEAFPRFLGEDKWKEVLDKGEYSLSPQIREDRLKNAGFSFSGIHKYKNEFYETPQGSLWYESQFPDLAKTVARGHQTARKHMEKVLDGQRRTARRLDKIRFIG